EGAPLGPGPVLLLRGMIRLPQHRKRSKAGRYQRVQAPLGKSECVLGIADHAVTAQPMGASREAGREDTARGGFERLELTLRIMGEEHVGTRHQAREQLDLVILE